MALRPGDKNIHITGILSEPLDSSAVDLLTEITGAKVHVQRLLSSTTNLLGKTEIYKNTPEIYKVKQAYERWTKHAYQAVTSALKPVLPKIETRLPYIKEATTALEALKGVSGSLAGSLGLNEKVSWYSTLKKANITKLLESGTLQKEFPGISSQAWQEVAEVAGKGATLASIRAALDKAARSLTEFTSRTHKVTENMTKFQKELDEALKVPFGKQFAYGFTSPFKKLANTFGIPTGMGIGTAIGGFLGNLSVAGILGGLFLAGRTTKQSFTRYSETAPLKTQLAMKEILSGGTIKGFYGNLNEYSANMAAYGIREPEALQYLTQVTSLPSQIAKPGAIQSMQDLLFKLTAQFKTRGTNQEFAPQLISIMNVIGAIEKDISMWDKTSGGTKLIKLLDNTNLIGYKQNEFLKSLVETIQSNPAAFLGSKGFTGILDLSERLLQTGIPYLQGNAPRIAGKLYQGISNFGGKFAPLIWANAPGNSIWERFKAIQSPEYTGQILDRLSKTLNLRTDVGKVLFASMLKQFGIAGNLATEMTTLWNKQATGRLTREEENRKTELLQQAYKQSPEGRLNALVSLQESILRTLEGSIAGNVIKIAAATQSMANEEAYKKKLAHELVSYYESRKKTILERAKAEQWTPKQTEEALKNLDKDVYEGFGISPDDVKRIISRDMKKKVKRISYGKVQVPEFFGDWATDDLKEYAKKKKEMMVSTQDIIRAKVHKIIPDNILPIDLQSNNFSINSFRLQNFNPYSDYITNLLTQEKERLNQERQKALMDVRSNPVSAQKRLAELQLREKQMQEFITDFNKIQTQPSSVDKSANLEKLLEQIERFVKPQTEKPTASNSINITINIDNNTALNQRVASTGDIYANISEAILQGLKEAFNRAGLYDLNPTIPLFKGVAQG